MSLKAGTRLAFGLLLARAASAQVPPASPLGILHVPQAGVPEGATSMLGVSTGLDLAKRPIGAWGWRGDEVRADLMAAVSGWNRVELGVVLPLRFRVDSQAADPWLANRVAMAPLHLDGKLVVLRRPEGARGFGAAVRVGSDLPFDQLDTARFNLELGAIADVRLAHDILVAAHLALATSARYRFEDPAFQSIAWGIGIRAPLSANLTLLGELWGRTSFPGSVSTEIETSAGIQVRRGHVFVTGSAGLSLPDQALLLRLMAHVGGGEGVLPPSEREDTEPPEGGCIEMRCTRQQIAAVARAHAARLDALRANLLATAAAIQLRIRERSGTRTREIVRLTIPNDLSIANDAERKRELSVRFLVAAFARSGLLIDRRIAERLIDATGWHVQVERTIDEQHVDYFTFDLPRLASAWAGLLRDDAAQLRLAQLALRAAWVETDQLFLDIARGHANGLIGVINGALDLPLAPVNAALFLTGHATIRGAGRIPHLEYKSDWGRKYGAVMETGVALGLMTKPGASLFAGAGRTVAPAVVRIGGELSSLVWNGIPIGRIALGILSRWMAGSVVALKVHAAGEIGAILRALITKTVEMPGEAARPLTEDDVEQMVLALAMDAALLKGAEEAKEAVEEGKWERPPGWRLPKNGIWLGEEGNSAFKPHEPAKCGLGPDDVIVFRKGWADFSPWMVEEFEVPGMNGDHPFDSTLINQHIAKRKGLLKVDGGPNASAAKEWLRARDLFAHHAGGNKVQLVPRALHENIRHTGGAFELRNLRKGQNG